MLDIRTRHVQGSITAPIAWLSTCLLAGGLGAIADPDLHRLWLRAGCFGLVSAAGLEGVARTRARCELVRRRRAAQKRCDRSLQHFVAERDLSAERKAAVQRMLNQRAPVARAAGTGEEARWGCNLPVEIFPVRPDIPLIYRETDDQAATGRLINLSDSGFGLELDQPIARQLVVISLLPPHEQAFDLLGELLWCETTAGDRLRGGGRLIRILAHRSSDSADGAQAAAEQPLAEATL